MKRKLNSLINLVAIILLVLHPPLLAGQNNDVTPAMPDAGNVKSSANELNMPPVIRSGGLYYNFFNPYYHDGGVIFNRLEKNRIGELTWKPLEKQLDFKNLPPFMAVAVDFEGHGYAASEDAANGYGIRLFNPEASSTKFLFKLPEAMSKIAIKPNGNIVAINASDKPPFKVYEFSRNGTVVSIKTGAVKYHSIAFAASGKLYGVYIHSDDGGLYLYEIKDDWSGQKRLTQAPFYNGILTPSNLCITEKGLAVIGAASWYQLDLTNGVATRMTDLPMATYTGTPQIVCR